jgi:hypothetical protein
MTDVQAPEWQRGYSLPHLRAFVAPFKERHKALVHSGFGLTKERDVAEALAAKRAIWTGGNNPTAIALFTVPKTVSRQSDFAQREFSVLPGQINVKAFAARDVASGVWVLQALVERAGTPVWLEIFEEDDTAVAVVAAMDRFRYVTSKVMAGSEIKGVYTDGTVPVLPEFGPEELAALEEVMDRDFLPAGELAAIKVEVAAFKTLWGQDGSSHNRRASWAAFALRRWSTALRRRRSARITEALG